MWHLLASPTRADEYETFAARILHYTLLLLLAVASLFAFFVTSPSQLVFIPFVLALFGGCYYLLHKGHLQLASFIFLGGLWITITLASFSLNGIRNASVSSYAIVIIFAAILISVRAVVIFTIASIGSSILLAAGEMAGILPLRTTPLYLADRFFQQIALFGAAGILLAGASRVIRVSIQRIRQHEKALLEHNQALESEINERQQIEAQLRISEEKYRLLFENSPVMAAIYGQDGEIVLLNHAAARMMDGTREALQGRRMGEVFDAEHAEGWMRTQTQVIETGKDDLNESKVTLPNGREVYHQRHVMPLPHITNASQVLVLTTDLTEKYLAEQRERELALAQEKNNFLTDFFRTISHDLKTPLAIMTTGLYLLKRAETPDKRDEKISGLKAQIERMDQYLQDMITISRLEHVPTFSFQAVDLNRLIDQVVNLLRSHIERKQLKIHLNAQPGLPHVVGDEDQLVRMLTNLVENAVNYTPAGGTITVASGLHDGQVGLDITDTGIGIEQAALPHIFERFFRTQNAKTTHTGGTGLGLAIVKKIVDNHDATITVSSQPGEGTTFRVQFSETVSPAAIPSSLPIPDGLPG
jgi:PAS domain S-box-containing protein